MRGSPNWISGFSNSALRPILSGRTGHLSAFILPCHDHGCLKMLVEVYVTPNAREARVVKVGEDYFEVRVDEKAIGGRANKRLVEILAEHFDIPKSRISIVRGAKSRNKIVQMILERTAD